MPMSTFNYSGAASKHGYTIGRLHNRGMNL